MIEFVCQTGLRRGEVCALRWDWIDGEYLRLPCGPLFRTKSGRDERVFLTAAARTELTKLSRATDRVFAAPNPERVSARFRHWRRAAGLPRGSFHSLRHTCAAWMAMSGASAYVIKEHLRHSSITVTERYMHLAPSEHARLVERALRF
jgi:integrase